MIDKIIYWIGAFVVAAVVGSDAHAAAPVTHYRIVYNTVPYTSSTQAGACNALAAARSGQADGTGFIFTGVGEVNSGLCRLYKKDATGYQSWSNYTIQAVSMCANGTAPDTNKPLDQQCPDACPADGSDGPKVEYTTGWRTGPDVNSAWAKGGTTTPSAGCLDGCKITVWGKNPWFKSSPGANGYYEFGYDLSTMHTGQSCTSTDPAITANEVGEPTDPPPEKNRCPRGTVQTGTDSAGIPICRGDEKPKNDTNKKTSSTTTTNADGSTTTTTTTTTTNSDGSTTTKTTTTTKDPGGDVISSEEKTDVSDTPDGKDGESDSTEEDKQDLCKQNPSLNICKNSEISGSCEAVSCTGDAIQCAIARDVQAAKCKAEKDEQAIKDSAAHKAGSDAAAGSVTGLPDPSKPESVGVGSIQANGFLGGGSCFADKTVSVLGHEVRLPFSAACEYLIVFRGVVMLIGLLASFRMLSGTFLRD